MLIIFFVITGTNYTLVTNCCTFPTYKSLFSSRIWYLNINGLLPHPSNGDLHRAGDWGIRSGNQLSLGNTAIWVSSIFRDSAMTELMLFPIFPVMFLMCVTVSNRQVSLFYILVFFCTIRFNLSVILTSNFSHFADLENHRKQTPKRNITHLLAHTKSHHTNSQNLKSIYWI